MGLSQDLGVVSILCMAGRENDLFATMMIRGALVSSLPSDLECRALKFLNQLAPNFSQAKCITVSCQVSMGSSSTGSGP